MNSARHTHRNKSNRTTVSTIEDTVESYKKKEWCPELEIQTAYGQLNNRLTTLQSMVSVAQDIPSSNQNVGRFIQFGEHSIGILNWGGIEG